VSGKNAGHELNAEVLERYHAAGIGVIKPRYWRRMPPV
jgi:hypothetical protein